jgi:O-antigen/teichoic acid export membrane protein
MNKPNERESTISPLSLRANFSWTFVGNVIYAASLWGILVVLAKLGTPEMVGQYALALAVTAPIIMFSNLQLRGVQATDARQEYQFGDYLGLRLLTTLLAYSVIIGIVLLSDYGRETSLVILFIGLSKSFEAISDIIFGLLQYRERMDRIAKSLIIEGPATLAVMTVILWLTHNIVLGVAGLAIVWGLQLMLYDRRSAVLIIRASYPDENVWSLLRPRWNFRTLRQLIWLALPLGFVMMLISLNTAIPRYIIEREWGETLLGYYAALAYLLVAGQTFVAALGQSATPRLSKYFANGNNRAFRSLLARLVGIGAVLGMGAVLVSVVAGKFLLSLIYKPDYAAYNDIFILIMIASGITYIASFLGYGMTAARKFKEQLPLFIVVVSCTALGGLSLIPSHGLKGAALTLIVSTTINFVFSLIVVIRAIQKNNSNWRESCE